MTSRRPHPLLKLAACFMFEVVRSIGHPQSLHVSRHALLGAPAVGKSRVSHLGSDWETKAERLS